MTKVYEIITDKIIDQLEKGCVPWSKPWSGGERPANLITKKAYTGINAFILGCQDFTSHYWVSFKQCKDLGGNVKKGEHGTMIVFWKQVSIKNEDEEKTIPLLRYYLVWNLSQCENINQKRIPVIETNQNFQPIAACEETVSGMPKKPVINHGAGSAYYKPTTDQVYIPNKENFQAESN